MATILEENNGELRFSDEITEYILDENMELKAVRLKDGKTLDSEQLHRDFTPKHPLIQTPQGLKRTLDQFFIHEFKDRRILPLLNVPE